jgi:hypothetical protein
MYRYRYFRNSLGQIDAINRVSDGATVPTWDLEHPLTIEYQTWLAENPEFAADLGDRPDLAYDPFPVQPNWDEFFDENILLLAQLLEQSPQPTIADFLKIEFGKRPDLNCKRLCNYWNLAIAGLTTEQIATLNTSAAQYNLPISLNEQGQMIGDHD